MPFYFPERAQRRTDLLSSYRDMAHATFSPEQLEEFREAFKLFDKDGGGTISISEIRAIMDTRGERLSDAELAELMTAIDEDRSGEIDFDEFCKMMAVVSVKLSPQEELLAAFQHFDVQNKGKFGKIELEQVFKELGQSLTAQDMADIFEVMDNDKDGGITFDDFKTLMGVN